MNNATRRETVRTPITLDSLAVGDFQKPGTLTAQVRQTVTRTDFYPSKRVDNELSGGLFNAEAFGFTEQSFENVEQRVAWVLVPEGIEEAVVLGEIAKANANGGCIYRVLSSKPIISKDQQWSIDKGLRTLDDYADSQAMRYPDGHESEGQLILDSNKNVQYRKTFFWPVERADEDIRSVDGRDFYLSANLHDEVGAMAAKGDTPSIGGFAGQSIEDVPF